MNLFFSNGIRSNWNVTLVTLTEGNWNSKYPSKVEVFLNIVSFLNNLVPILFTPKNISWRMEPLEIKRSVQRDSFNVNISTTAKIFSEIVPEKY